MQREIGLEGKYHIVTVSEKGYQLILEIVKAHLVCAKCGNPYDDGSPRIALNMCLGCFQKRHKDKQFAYIGMLNTDERGYETHMFIDPEGFVYYTGITSEQDPQKSAYQTLLHWGYPVPTQIIREDKEVQLSTWYWQIYGDVKKNSVLYIEHDPRYSDTKEVAFLTTRNGGFEEVNRRKGKYQKLFKQARTNLEATKDSRGYYHVNGHEVYGIYMSYIYEGVAELASAEHDRGKEHE